MINNALYANTLPTAFAEVHKIPIQGMIQCQVLSKPALRQKLGGICKYSGAHENKIRRFANWCLRIELAK
jgi:hypothetical protein